MDHKHQFSCLQYNLPNTIGQRIFNWGHDNIPDTTLYHDPQDPFYGRENLIHCTLFFGLHANNAMPVMSLLENENPFLIRLGQTSCFTNEKFDVVKIEVYGQDLFRIHDKIGNSLPCTQCHNLYKPHITIAYVKSGEGNKFIGDTRFDRTTLRVDSLYFSSKNNGKRVIPLCPKQKIGV